MSVQSSYGRLRCAGQVRYGSVQRRVRPNGKQLGGDLRRRCTVRVKSPTRMGDGIIGRQREHRSSKSPSARSGKSTCAAGGSRWRGFPGALADLSVGMLHDTRYPGLSRDDGKGHLNYRIVSEEPQVSKLREWAFWGLSPSGNSGGI
ncbi:unnamed protein product [Tuber aestivum]|uniref:Uncharacterized protein n=1 Tax=Tuber aestivum TaxID=59557 RepID=A0A292PPZ7_9PEZI|nr:unnamed protein product [Tuber aestivum]